MVDRYAIIKDGKVDNVVLWDGKSNWTPPEGIDVVAADSAASIGDDYDKENGFSRQAVEEKPQDISLDVLVALLKEKQIISSSELVATRTATAS